MERRSLELDFECFTALRSLLTLILREEVICWSWRCERRAGVLDYLEAQGELDLETATEFIVLMPRCWS